MADLLELGRKPVSEAQPAGQPSREDPAFERLEAEFRKLELPEQPAVDWGKAVDDASAILGSKSKDVKAASYLAIALFERDGYPGLDAGTQVLADLLDAFWDQLYPDRPKGRRSSLAFLGERGGQRVKLRGRDGATRETLEKIVTRLETLDASLSQKLEDGSGLFGPLVSELRDVLGGLAAPAPPSAAPAAGASTAGGGVTVAAPGAIGSQDEFDQAVQAVRPALAAMAEWRAAQDPKDPMAYRLRRIAAWLRVRQAPPSDGGKTNIPPPQPADLATRLETMLANQAWRGVLEETESRVGAAIFWLDLHQFAWAALKGQGPEFQPAADAVAAEVKDLLRRAPGLVDLRFANDAPLASPRTREWIDGTVLAAPSGGPPKSGAPGVRGEGPGEVEGLAEARDEAAKLAAAGQLGPAVEALERGAARATRVRDRAVWKVELARLCVDQARPEVALAQLEALEEDLGRSTLDAWDPPLAADLVRLLLWARQRAIPPAMMTAEEHQKTRELQRRLSRLDPAAALELQRPSA